MGLDIFGIEADLLRKKSIFILNQQTGGINSSFEMNSAGPLESFQTHFRVLPDGVFPAFALSPLF